MIKNVGSVDKVIRVSAAIIIGILLLTRVLEGTVGTILGLIGVLLLLTSAAGFCPAYLPLKISTRKPKPSGQQ